MCRVDSDEDGSAGVLGGKIAHDLSEWSIHWRGSIVDLVPRITIQVNVVGMSKVGHLPMMGYPCSSYDHPAEGTGIIPVAKGCGGCRWDRVENALGYKGGVQVRVVSVDDLLCQFSRFWVSCRLFAGMYSVLW